MNKKDPPGIPDECWKTFSKNSYLFLHHETPSLATPYPYQDIDITVRTTSFSRTCTSGYRDDEMQALKDLEPSKSTIDWENIKHYQTILKNTNELILLNRYESAKTIAVYFLDTQYKDERSLPYLFNSIFNNLSYVLLQQENYKELLDYFNTYFDIRTCNKIPTNMQLYTIINLGQANLLFGGTTDANCFEAARKLLANGNRDTTVLLYQSATSYALNNQISAEYVTDLAALFASYNVYGLSEFIDEGIYVGNKLKLNAPDFFESLIDQLITTVGDNKVSFGDNKVLLEDFAVALANRGLFEKSKLALSHLHDGHKLLNGLIMTQYSECKNIQAFINNDLEEGLSGYLSNNPEYCSYFYNNVMVVDVDTSLTGLNGMEADYYCNLLRRFGDKTSLDCYSLLINSTTEEDDNNEILYTNKAIAQLYRQNLPGAIQDLRTAVSLNPSDAKSNYLLGFITFFQSGYNKQVKELFDQVLKINRYDPNGLFLGWLVKYITDETPQQLEDIPPRLIENNYFFRGLILFIKARRETKDIKQDWNTAIKSTNGKSKCLRRSVSTLSYHRVKRNQNNKAVQSQEALPDIPENSSAEQSDNLIAPVMDDITVGQLNKAYGYFEEELKRNPNDSFSHFYKGIIEYSLGDPKEALEYIDKAIELNPNHVYNYIYRGFIVEKEDAERAFYDFAKAIKLIQVKVGYYGNLVYPEYHEVYGAFEHYIWALIPGGLTPIDYTLRGVAKYLLKYNTPSLKFETSSLNEFSKAMKLESGSFIYYYISIAAYQESNYSVSLAYINSFIDGYERLIQKSYDEVGADVLLLKAKCLFNLGDFEQAIDLLKGLVETLLFEGYKDEADNEPHEEEFLISESFLQNDSNMSFNYIMYHPAISSQRQRNYEIFYFLGLSYFYKKDYKKAISYFNQIESHYNYIVKGLADIGTLVLSDPELNYINISQVLSFRGAIYLSLGKHELALEDYNESIYLYKVHPDRAFSLADIYYERAIVFMRLNSSENALLDLNAYLNLQKNNPTELHYTVERNEYLRHVISRV
jgi:tetratricopeptide (TPR) repeat protein